MAKDYTRVIYLHYNKEPDRQISELYSALTTKVCTPIKAIVKKMVNPRWQPRNDYRLKAKI